MIYSCIVSENVIFFQMFRCFLILYYFLFIKMRHSNAVAVRGRMHDDFGSGEALEDGFEVRGSSLPEVAVDATLGADPGSYSQVMISCSSSSS